MLKMKKLKSKLIPFSKKKGQEEMVGFALIMIIVMVIILIFLGFSLSKPQVSNVESYEIDSFVQVFLQYHTECEDNLEHLTIQKLISRCKTGGNNCQDGRTMCNALESEDRMALAESWKVVDRPEAGFPLILLNEETQTELIHRISEGNVTQNYKGTTQYPTSDIQLIFNVYY